MIKNRYIGRFKLSRKMINDYPSDVLKCMQNMIVLEAHINPVSDCFEYTAINPLLFDGVAIGVMCSEYKVTYDATKDEVAAEKIK